MPIPSVSVVIPTHSRPKLLARAVDSCFQGVEPNSVEVIVVANGGGSVPEAIFSRSEVRMIELPEPNANAARNAGLALARGRFVRFLDDDDYLIPEGAASQCATAENTRADVCTGVIQLLDEAGAEIQTITPRQASGDFVAAMLAPGAATQTTANLFRTDFLKGLCWDDTRPHLHHDVDWMHSIMRRSETNWAIVDQPVGVWEHHTGPRLSTGMAKKFPNLALREMSTITRGTIEILKSQRRLTDARRQAGSEALWHYAHLGFPMSPMYWTGVANVARQLAPQSRPEPSFYHGSPWRYLHPLLLEWLLVPKRYLNARLRALTAARPASLADRTNAPADI